MERLNLISATSTYLSVDALHAAITEAKQGKDVTLYTVLTDRLHQIIPDDPLGVPDVQWCERKAKEVKAELESLEQQLKQYKNNLIKESIRVGPPWMLSVGACSLTRVSDGPRRPGPVLHEHRRPY